MIYKSLKRSFATIFSPDFIWILLKILLITLGTILFFFTLCIYSINVFTSSFSINLWLSVFIIKFLGSIGIFIISWFLSPFLVPLIVIFFEENIANIVSREYGYINQAPDSLYNRAIIIYSIKSAMVMLLVNIMLLPLYFVPLFNIVLYYFLNSYLLGKFFVVSVIGRFEGMEKAKILQKKFSYTSLSIGFITILIGTIPILNLFTAAIILIVTNHFYFNSNSHN